MVIYVIKVITLAPATKILTLTLYLTLTHPNPNLTVATNPFHLTLKPTTYVDAI